MKTICCLLSLLTLLNVSVYGYSFKEPVDTGLSLPKNMSVNINLDTKMSTSKRTWLIENLKLYSEEKNQSKLIGSSKSPYYEVNILSSSETLRVENTSDHEVEVKILVKPVVEKKKDSYVYKEELGKYCCTDKGELVKCTNNNYIVLKPNSSISFDLGTIESKLDSFYIVDIIESSNVAGEFSSNSSSMIFKIVDDSKISELEGPSKWAEESVDYMDSMDLIPLELKSKYRDNISRTEFCKIAVRVYERYNDKIEVKERYFEDIDDIDVEKMAKVGVVSGIAPKVFAGDKEITREQAATILVNLMKSMGYPLKDVKTEAEFSDIDSISNWALESVKLVESMGIMRGVSPTEFGAQQSYTVEQSIVTLARFLEKYTG